MRIRIAMLCLILLHLSGGASSTFGATTRAAPPASALPQAPGNAPTAPVLSEDARWVVGLVIVIVALIVAAGVIGPIYRLSLPDELPVTHSHDEPPGSSHHHGPSGTLDFSAPDDRIQ